MSLLRDTNLPAAISVTGTSSGWAGSDCRNASKIARGRLRRRSWDPGVFAVSVENSQPVTKDLRATRGSTDGRGKGTPGHTPTRAREAGLKNNQWKSKAAGGPSRHCLQEARRRVLCRGVISVQEGPLVVAARTLRGPVRKDPPASRVLFAKVAMNSKRGVDFGVPTRGLK